MSLLVVDASVAVKWVYYEELSEAAQALREGHQFVAPDFFLAECANILWKKVSRSELAGELAKISIEVLAAAGVELVPTREVVSRATRLAIEIGHPAYDCCYLSLAKIRGLDFVTADERLLRKLAQSRSDDLPTCHSLREFRSS